MTKRHRWVCPVCETGRLLPTRLSKEDARSICVPCTEQALKDAKGGKSKFVRLFCPTKDKRREKKAQERREKAASEAEARKLKRQEEKEIWNRAFLREGVDLRTELKRLEKRTQPFSNGRNPRPLHLCVPDGKHLWGFEMRRNSPNPTSYFLRVYGNTLAQGRLSIVFGLVSMKVSDSRDRWRREVSSVCNDLFGIRMNWELNPAIRTRPDKKPAKRATALYYEALEQIRLRSLDFTTFMDELREAVYQDNSSRARLMVNLVDDEADRQVARDYTNKHF